MTIFEQFIVIYFISASALAGVAVLWRNWLHDHPRWKAWLTKALTCGSCFTFWITLAFVLALNPFYGFLITLPSFSRIPIIGLFLLQWMSLGWGALFLRFAYVTLQETVALIVHKSSNNPH